MKLKKEDVYNFLRRSGLRMTKLKIEIVDLFLEGSCGLSVKDVIARLASNPDVSTVYRAMNSLTLKGFLRHSVGSEGVVQYRCTSAFYPDHGHFKCVKCGGTIAVRRKLPEDFLRVLEVEYGVSVKSASFLLEGKCLKCRNL
ncbi:MAG: transcriptional repressor [Candidatus Sabulitectum sp.]|nr:transcriptional repressor [Candidatus Sabulitectum sp.]